MYVPKGLQPLAEQWVRNYDQAMTVFEEILGRQEVSAVPDLTPGPVTGQPKVRDRHQQASGAFVSAVDWYRRAGRGPPGEPHRRSPRDSFTGGLPKTSVPLAQAGVSPLETST